MGLNKTYRRDDRLMQLKRRSLEVPEYDRSFFDSGARISRIGTGQLGGKAEGLALAREILDVEIDPMHFGGIRLDVPATVVLTTDFFDAFVQKNGIDAEELASLDDDAIGRRCQEADIPPRFVGDLRSIVEQVATPLAVRSSSLLEDAMYRPFAGVYGTKMLPNNQPDPSARFHRLTEAVKFVIASTFTKRARDYQAAVDRSPGDEKMAVAIQEVVGRRHDIRYYPDVSGVGRSFNFYPLGGASREEGVVDLALGLGKTIVDGGLCWTYSPGRPKSPPPFASAGDTVRNTQTRFWAVNMGPPAEYNPVAETEYLVNAGLREADYDDALRRICSTYDAPNDRLVMGTSIRGPRVLTFAPLLRLREIALNELITTMLNACEQALGVSVEIEFALTIPGRGLDARLGFLQLRPMVVAEEEIRISDEELRDARLLVASHRAMGNGENTGLRDVVFVMPDRFDAALTSTIASELAAVNMDLIDEGIQYMLIGFGRWGSVDPWLGIPVVWGDISGARVIVEATLPNMNVEISQGSHFFHNISSFGVHYLSVRHDGPTRIDWDWLARQPSVRETEHVRHVRVDEPLLVRVDGRSGRAGVWHNRKGTS